MTDPPANVVLIEDSPTEAALALALLEREPCHLQLAATGLMGLRMVERIEPEVVLLDINLPDMSGLDVLDRVRAAAIPPTVVMVTGHSGIDMVVECMRRRLRLHRQALRQPTHVRDAA